MSDDDRQRRRELFNEQPDLVVERHPDSKISILPVIIVLSVVYLFFVFSPEEKSIIESVSNSINSGSERSGTKAITATPKERTLHQLVVSGNAEQVKQQLLIKQDSINSVLNGMTPIMLAASQGNVEIIDLLFTQGADPNKRGSMQRTALQYAAEKNHIEAAKRLLSYGADIDAYDNGRLTPLIMAASRGYPELGLLFIEKGADVNIQHVDGWTALIDATAHGDIRFVKALLEAGADTELVAKNGKKAIDYAREYGFKNIEKILTKSTKKNSKLY